MFQLTEPSDLLWEEQDPDGQIGGYYQVQRVHGQTFAKIHHQCPCHVYSNLLEFTTTADLHSAHSTNTHNIVQIFLFHDWLYNLFWKRKIPKKASKDFGLLSKTFCFLKNEDAYFLPLNTLIQFKRRTTFRARNWKDLPECI